MFFFNVLFQVCIFTSLWFWEPFISLQILFFWGGQFLLSCLAVVLRGPPPKEIAGLIKGLWSLSFTLDNPLIRLIRHCSHEFHWMMPAIYHSCNWGSLHSWREEIQINMFVSSLKEFWLKGCSFQNAGAPQTHQNTIQRLAERKSLGTDYFVYPHFGVNAEKGLTLQDPFVIHCLCLHDRCVLLVWACCLCRSRANTYHTLIFLAWAFWNSKDFTPYDFHQNNIWCDDLIYTFVGCLPSLHLYLFRPYLLNLSTSQHLNVFKFITPASCHPCPSLPLVSSHTSKQEAGVDGGCVSRSGRRSRPILWKWLW